MPFNLLVQRTLFSGSLMFCVLTGAFSQAGFKVHGGAIYAFNFTNPDFPEGAIVSNGGGLFGAIDFVYLKENWRFEPGIGLGMKQLHVSGSAGPYDFTSWSTKVFTIAYCHFLFDDKWKAGPVILVENNKDFAEFLPHGNDHFRYNAGLSLEYEMHNRLEVYLRYFRSISPNANFYLIENPSDQLALGFSYKIQDDEN